MVKKLPANAGDIGVFGWILDEEDPLEEGLATLYDMEKFREEYGFDPKKLKLNSSVKTYKTF